MSFWKRYLDCNLRGWVLSAVLAFYEAAPFALAHLVSNG